MVDLQISVYLYRRANLYRPLRQPCGWLLCWPLFHIPVTLWCRLVICSRADLLGSCALCAALYPPCVCIIGHPPAWWGRLGICNGHFNPPLRQAWAAAFGPGFGTEGRRVSRLPGRPRYSSKLPHASCADMAPRFCVYFGGS